MLAAILAHLRRNLWVLFGALLCATSSLVAQQQREEINPPPPAPGTGAIYGQVVDAKGDPMPGVVIFLDCMKGKQAMHGELKTGPSGLYRFTDLPVDTRIRISFARRDFAFVIRDNIVLAADEERELEVPMIRNAVTLDEVKIVAAPPKGSSLAKRFIDGEELVKANVPSVYEALVRKRPIMFENMRTQTVVMCPPPDTVLTLYVNGLRRPLFDPIDTGQFSQQQQSSAAQLAQRARAGILDNSAKSPHMMALIDELSQIRPEDVMQVRYVGCEDRPQDDIPHRNAIWIVMKPGKN